MLTRWLVKLGLRTEQQRAWAMYDWANSAFQCTIITAVFPVYFASVAADRDAAQALYGAELWVARSQLPKAKPGEYYWADLEGLAVRNREGVGFGTVSHLFETPGNPVMVVAGERERLIPFLIGQYVDSVDLEAGLIMVDWDADF